MANKYQADVLPAQSMAPIGEYRWFARVRIKQIGTARESDFIRIPGEWHGKTSEEAESKARRAAEDWIARHIE